MTRDELAGVWAALWTPADGAGGVRLEELRGQAAFVRDAGVTGIMALGSTGEFLFFDPAVRKRILEEILSASGLPVIANVSELRPREVFDLAVHARKAGARAVAVLPPYFYPVDQSDLGALFVEVAERSGLPLVLYNFPERTGVLIELNTIEWVADRAPVIGVKQSGADFSYHSALVELGRRKGFAVLTGAEVRLDEAMDLGVVGTISGLANAVPEWIATAWNAVRTGERARLGEAMKHLHAIGACMDDLVFPLNVAAAMEARGLAIGELKPVLSNSSRERYAALVAKIRQVYDSAGLGQAPGSKR